MTPTSLLDPTPRTSHGSSFRRPMKLLPKQQREDLEKLYVICRTLDDAVDDAPTPQQALAALDAWHEDVKAAYAQQHTHTLLADLLVDLLTRYDFAMAHWQDMERALRMDALGRMVCPPQTELRDYCYGVASCVGLLSMDIFGCDDPQADDFAIHLGHAMQLTNILRDVMIDAKMGRIYLPQEWVPPALTPAMILQGDVDLTTTCASLGALAETHFEAAKLAAKNLPSRSIAPALAMGEVYQNYLEQLRAQNWQAPANGKLHLSARDKLRLGLKAKKWLTGA